MWVRGVDTANTPNYNEIQDRGVVQVKFPEEVDLLWLLALNDVFDSPFYGWHLH